MKKQIEILRIVLLMLITYSASAQIPVVNKNENTPTGYITAGAGIGLPLGEFQSEVLSDQYSGFAQPGLSSFIEFAMPIARSNFGFAVNFGYYSNSVDNTAVSAAEEAQNGNYWVENSYNYTLNTFMGGLYITIPVHKFSFDLKALAGVCIFTYPSQSLDEENLSTNQISNTESNSSTSTAFTFGGNFTIRYAVVKHFCALVQCGFIHTDPNYTASFYYLNGNNTPAFTTVGDQPITILHVSAGLGYQF